MLLCQKRLQYVLNCSPTLTVNVPFGWWFYWLIQQSEFNARSFSFNAQRTGIDFLGEGNYKWDCSLLSFSASFMNIIITVFRFVLCFWHLWLSGFGFELWKSSYRVNWFTNFRYTIRQNQNCLIDSDRIARLHQIRAFIINLIKWSTFDSISFRTSVQSVFFSTAFKIVFFSFVCGAYQKCTRF